MSNEIQRIRPAGRHLLTIGKDLIQDQYAAIIELVKNAYDADSPNVVVSFESNEDKNMLRIIVEDSGHGMTYDTVVNKWLVPSTNDKLLRRKSPKGRTMQGRKGIGRYAASILGKDLLLETVTSTGDKTEVYIDWMMFENSEYLDDVEILIETSKCNEPKGTRLTILGGTDDFIEWTDKQINKMKFELKKLIAPENTTFTSGYGEKDEKDVFQVVLKYVNFFPNQETPCIIENINPYPIQEFFDYQITGTVNENGSGELIYCNRKTRNVKSESIKVDYGHTGCGSLIIDIRVYDRDKDAIEQLISRGLMDEYTGDYVSNAEARKLLDIVNGIGVYRNGFRIRPLGDPDYDWLKLNIKRVQNPSMKIGSNQVIGYVHIESEEISGLEEKSARDGLKSNKFYERLMDVTLRVIGELEQRRFDYRRKMGVLPQAIKVEKELERLYDYTKLKKEISDTLHNEGISNNAINNIARLIEKEEINKSETLEEIKKTIAIYQGQATLGKIINIVLHEGRKPLNYFKNQIPNLYYYSEKFKTNPADENFEKILYLSSGIKENADMFVDLFGRLDPLAAKKRNTKTTFNILSVLNKVVDVFENVLKEKGISLKIECNSKCELEGWHQDIYIIFTNLLDNSIFWIEENNSDKKLISINVNSSNGTISTIDYFDTGAGIKKQLLDSGAIFEPEFSTKPNGTGLGLSIAGEAALRNGFELVALESDTGAHFRLR